MTPFFGLVKRDRAPRTRAWRRLHLEALEARCVLSGYQGTYVGSYSGSTNQGPQSGAVQFTVDSANQVTMTSPVSATGSVSSVGMLHVERPQNIQQSLSDVVFNGTFSQTSSGTDSFGGTWSVSFAPGTSEEISGGGDWSASTAATSGSSFNVNLAQSTFTLPPLPSPKGLLPTLQLDQFNATFVTQSSPLDPNASFSAIGTTNTNGGNPSPGRFVEVQPFPGLPTTQVAYATVQVYVNLFQTAPSTVTFGQVPPDASQMGTFLTGAHNVWLNNHQAGDQVLQWYTPGFKTYVLNRLGQPILVHDTGPLEDWVDLGDPSLKLTPQSDFPTIVQQAEQLIESKNSLIVFQKEALPYFFLAYDPGQTELLVTDPQGNRTGMTASGTVVQNIPGLAYYPTVPLVVVAAPNPGQYQTTITGLASGSYQFVTASVTPNQILKQQSVTGSINKGQSLVQVTTVSSAAKLGVERPAAGGAASLSLDSDGDGAFGSGDSAFIFGLASDKFLAGDWAGLGYDSVGVVRPTASGVAQFSLDNNGDNAFDAGDSVFSFGLNTDTFVVGDWNGSGTTKIGVVRPGADGVMVWSLDTNGDGVFDAGDTVTSYGLNSDTPLVGDWTGSGHAEIGVVRPTASGALEWVLNTTGTGTFNANDAAFFYGANGDLPVVGDWTGNGTTKIGVVRPTASGAMQWVLNTSGSGAYSATDAVDFYGANGDTTLVGRWASFPVGAPPGTGGPTNPSPTANPFAGTYAGTFSGSGTAFGITQPVSSGVNGTVDSNGNITVTNPGSGSGTVSSTGAAHLTGTGAIGVANADYVFDGTFVQATDGTISGSGNWSATFSGGSASGTWHVSRQ